MSSGRPAGRPTDGRPVMDTGLLKTWIALTCTCMREPYAALVELVWAWGWNVEARV